MQNDNTNAAEPVSMGDRMLIKALEQFPIIDYDFFNVVGFDVFFDDEIGYNLHFVYAHCDEEMNKEYGFLHRTSICKESLQDIADTLLMFLGEGMFRDLLPVFEGTVWDENGDMIDEVDWTEYFEKSTKIAKFEEIDEEDL